MGMFSKGRETDAERMERLTNQARNITEGKGFVGKMAKATMGGDRLAQMGEAMNMADQINLGAQLVAEGHAAVRASVTALADTGQSINDNPVLSLSLVVDGAAVSMRSLVSRIQIPRVGEEVFVVRNPADGQFVYVGPAPRA